MYTFLDEAINLLKVSTNTKIDYKAIADGVAALVEQKQEAYGDAFSRAGGIIQILYPDGIPVHKYDDALTIVRVIDKLFRVATDNDPSGESPWADIVGYGLLSLGREWSRKEEVTEGSTATYTETASGEPIVISAADLSSDLGLG